jgi:tRNA (Thr-GGU) A37 N-methylase
MEKGIKFFVGLDVSPHRPNPLGLHRVTVREISGTRLRIGPIEAVDGTPVVDVKRVLVDCDDA